MITLKAEAPARKIISPLQKAHLLPLASCFLASKKSYLLLLASKEVISLASYFLASKEVISLASCFLLSCF